MTKTTKKEDKNENNEEEERVSRIRFEFCWWIQEEHCVSSRAMKKLSEKQKIIQEQAQLIKEKEKEISAEGRNAKDKEKERARAEMKQRLEES